MARRWGLALGLSVLAHLLLVVATVAVGARPFAGSIDVEITGLDTAQVTDLPLGGPPPGKNGAAHAPRRAHHRAPPAADQAELAAGADQDQRSGRADGEEEASGPAPTDDLNAYGPRGSRLTVLMRLDRLRSSDLAPGIEALLARLPDYRDLLEGTRLDLFRSFDALLIATPHPLDPSVTFLAVRHQLDDGRLRAALADGARATDRSLSWSNDRGRWIAERRPRHKSAVASSRDDRLIVLPAPGLVVVTPPAYRSLLLHRAPKAGASPSADAGQDTQGADAGAPVPAPIDWATLLSRIDAEEGLMPPDGDVMMSAVDIFKSRNGEAPLVYGMEIPAAARAVAGIIGDEPFVDVTAEFAEESQARHWETAWPGLQAKLRGNAMLMLGGFTSLLGRITLERQGQSVRLHLTATHDETLRLMGVALHFLGG